MYHFFVIITILLLFAACNNEAPTIEQPPIATEIPPTTEKNYRVETFKHENGWGYNIVLNDKPFIRQASIPSLPGNQGFVDEAKAKKTGEFVLYKIQNGLMPPSTNKEELDSLGTI